MRALLHRTVILPQYIPQPINDWALCQNISPKEIKTASGLVLPQDEAREDLAAVIAIGQGVMTATGAYGPFMIRPGDIVRTTRKKGRTAYLDCMGPEGVGDSQTAYNYYQWNEIIAVEYHSEWLAAEIKKISKEYPILVTCEEEEAYNKATAAIEAEAARLAEEKEKERQERIKARRELKNTFKTPFFKEESASEGE